MPTIVVGRYACVKKPMQLLGAKVCLFLYSPSKNW